MCVRPWRMRPVHKAKVERARLECRTSQKRRRRWRWRWSWAWRRRLEGHSKVCIGGLKPYTGRKSSRLCFKYLNLLQDLRLDSTRLNSSRAETKSKSMSTDLWCFLLHCRLKKFIMSDDDDDGDGGGRTRILYFCLSIFRFDFAFGGPEEPQPKLCPSTVPRPDPVLLSLVPLLVCPLVPFGT